VGLYALVGEDRADLEARFDALRRWTPGGGLEGVDVAEWGRDKLVGTVDQVVERLGRFAELGVEEMIVSLGSLPFAVYDESQLDVLAEAVIPAARSV
jgi:alkanesulfonate monooxygenase SsuD/methylene tetrahydromethanopterin reductase-like flavin-dependent oxidoreductase (luciferase family)